MNTARYINACGVLTAARRLAVETPPVKEEAEKPKMGFIAVDADAYETDPDDYDDDDDEYYDEDREEEPIPYTVVVKTYDVEDEALAEDAVEWYLLKTFAHVEIKRTRVLKNAPRDWDLECGERGYDYAGRIFKR